MRKAGNIINISLLIVLIIALIATIIGLINFIFNYGKINLDNMNDKKAQEKVVYDVILSAGNSSLKALNINFQNFQTKVSGLTYADLKTASKPNKDGQDIFTLANKIIKEFNLPRKQVSPKGVKKETLTTLIYVLNFSTTNNFGDKSPYQKDIKNYVELFDNMLKLSKAPIIVPQTNVKPTDKKSLNKNKSKTKAK